MVERLVFEANKILRAAIVKDLVQTPKGRTVSGLEWLLEWLDDIVGNASVMIWLVECSNCIESKCRLTSLPPTLCEISAEGTLRG